VLSRFLKFAGASVQNALEADPDADPAKVTYSAAEAGRMRAPSLINISHRTNHTHKRSRLSRRWVRHHGKIIVLGVDDLDQPQIGSLWNFFESLSPEQPEETKATLASFSTSAKLDALYKWKDLLLYKVPDDIVTYLQSRSMSVQYAHNESYSDDLNFDLYPVRITRFPRLDGSEATPQTLIKYIRAHINELLDTSISNFHPYDPVNDGARWAAADPVKAVLKIDIFPDNAAVVVSKATPTGWIFTTIKTPDTGAHPVSGHRHFYIGKNEDGTYYFINKGVDMTSSGIAGLGVPVFGEYGYRKAEGLWVSLQTKLTELMNANGGNARTEKRVSERIEWRLVYTAWKNALEKVFGKGAGSPEHSAFFDFS
jgi:hypothetical protein